MNDHSLREVLEHVRVDVELGIEIFKQRMAELFESVVHGEEDHEELIRKHIKQ